MKLLLGRVKRGIIGIWHSLSESTPSPNGLQATDIGSSVQGRSILSYEIGIGSRSVVFVSAIHGNEVGTTKLAYRLIDWLQAHPQEIEGLTCHVIPCLNPDGQAVAKRHPSYFNDGRQGRFNAHGVDLNRNFTTASFTSTSHWTHGKDYQDLTVVSCGPAGNSEPETKAVSAFLASKRPMACFGFHSAGRDVMGNSLSLAQQLAKAFSQATGYRLFSLKAWNEAGRTGTMKEWCEEQGIPYVEVEASYRWGSDWNNQVPGLAANLKQLVKE